jgi:hypothetical protein
MLVNLVNRKIHQPMTQALVSEKEHVTLGLTVTAEQKNALLLLFKAMSVDVEVYEEDDDEPVMTREEIIADLKEAVADMKLHRQGKLELRSLTTREEINAFLNEL